MGVYLGGPQEVTVTDYTQAQGPCPSGFHVPMKSERQALYNMGTSLGAWGYSQGVNLKSYIKLPFAGSRHSSNSNVTSSGTLASYWSSSQVSGYANFAYYFQATSYVVGPSVDTNISHGMSIRPFKDTPVTPDNSWTKLYSGTGNAGIYRKSSLGLISISSDGETWITIADKNLGATTVYDGGNTLNEANCGKFYQMGNNYGFPFSGSVTTSSTKVNAQNYGPGNYYSSSTFITGSGWDSSNNPNLRGGETVIQQKTIYPELKNAYIGEYKGLEYSYDFSNKSTATLQSDGWTLVQSASNYSFNSDGITASSFSRVYIQPSGFSTAIQNAEKITITAIYKKTGNNADYNVGIFTDLSSATNGSYQYSYDAGYEYCIGGTSKGSVSYSFGNSTYTRTIVIDLKNKTANFSISGVNTSNYTLTDTQISNIKTNTGLRVAVNRNGYIKSVSITIE